MVRDVITHRKTNRQVAGKRALVPPNQRALLAGEKSIAIWNEKRRVGELDETHMTMCTALSRCIAVRPCVDTCIKVRASVSERDDPSTPTVETASIVMHHTDIRA